MKKLTSGVFMLAVALMFVVSNSLSAQVSVNGKDCVGIWKTVDDETGRTKSHVQIYKKGSNYHAKIIKLLDSQTLKDSGKSSFDQITCDKCPDGRGKGGKMIGTEIIWDMEKESDKWAGGKIMDPKKGKIYTCTMWMDDSDSSGDKLSVRGWVGFFYRTQSWYRVK